MASALLGLQVLSIPHRIKAVPLTIVHLGSNHPRADGHEEHALFSVLCCELCHCSTQSSLAYRVRSSYFNIVLGYQVNVSHARGNGNNLFDTPFEYERQVKVEQMDVSKDVGVETVQ